MFHPDVADPSVERLPLCLHSLLPQCASTRRVSATTADRGQKSQTITFKLKL